MSDTQYIFDTQANSYFRGSDLRVTQASTGDTIIVNIKDDMWAVEVKDEVVFSSWPLDVQEAIEKIGDEKAQSLYEGVQSQFWDWANDRAKEDGFGGATSSGRSGGWLAVEGSAYRLPEIIEPSSPEELEARDAFLALAFEAVESIEKGWRPTFFDEVKAAAAEPAPSGTEPIAVLAITFADEATELYRNVPAVEAAFGILDDDVAAELIETCRKAVNGGDETLYTTFNGDEARVEYLKVREA